MPSAALTLPPATLAHPSRESCRSRGRSEGAVPEGPARRTPLHLPHCSPRGRRRDGGGKGPHGAGGSGREQDAGAGGSRRWCRMRGAGAGCLARRRKPAGGGLTSLASLEAARHGHGQGRGSLSAEPSCCCSGAALGAVTAAPRDGLRAPRPPRPAPRPSRRAGWLRAAPEPSRQLVCRAGRGRASRPPRGWG